MFNNQKCRGLRPKSAPGLRKFSKIHKGRRGTVDPERLISHHNRNAIARHELHYEKSFNEARKSYSPTRIKKKGKSKKRKSGKKTKGGKNKLENTAAEEITDIPRILNFKVQNIGQGLDITLQEARAAFFIYMFWKVNKYMRDLEDKMHVSTLIAGSTARVYSPQNMMEDEDLKSDTDEHIEASYHKQSEYEVEESENEDDELKSYRDAESIHDGIYETALKNKSSRDLRHSKSSQSYIEQDSEITQVHVNSPSEHDQTEEAKYNEEQRIFREIRRDSFEDGSDHKDKRQILSPHNPFDAMEDTIDAREKVVHLSTINTNENFAQDDFKDELSEEDIIEDIHEDDIKKSANEPEEVIEESASVVKMISHKDENEGSELTEKSDAKQKLFSGPDSLLREIISRTPRSPEVTDIEHPRINIHAYDESGRPEEDNSDSATRKRVDVSHLAGTMTPNSSASSQFFQNNSSFQNFSLLQFNNMIESKDFGVLLQLREKAIKYREKAEKKLISKMMESQKYSPRMLMTRQLELEKWVTKEKEEINKTKNHLLEKWNQTKAIIEQTEQNARIVKQQLASVDCSRRASMNFASPISDHGIDSLNLQSYREESKSEKSHPVDEDDETKAIHYSEPHRLLQSESENLGANHTNSAISLRISVLSNKSEEVEINKHNIELFKLQRTRQLGRLSSLISNDMFVERKNQSETFQLGNVFKNLLDENDGFDKIMQQNPQMNPEANNKIFEYKPHQEDNLKLDEPVKEELDKKSGSELPQDKLDEPQFMTDLDKLNIFEDEGEIKTRGKRLSNESGHNHSSSDFNPDHHRRLSSNDFIGINKVDDLNIEELLGGEDEGESNGNDYLESYENDFQNKLDQKFLKEFNKEIGQYHEEGEGDQLSNSKDLQEDKHVVGDLINSKSESDSEKFKQEFEDVDESLSQHTEEKVEETKPKSISEIYIPTVTHEKPSVTSTSEE